MNCLKKIFLYVWMTLCLTGCEHTICFEEGSTRIKGIVVNALATTDTVLMASVSKAYLFTEIPSVAFLDYWLYEKHPDPFYEKNAVIENANIVLRVNDAKAYNMWYDSVHYNYRSNYIPSPGDVIELAVSANEWGEASAKTHIPQAEQLEVLEYDKYYNKSLHNDDGFVDFAQDTIVQIKLRLTDPGTEENYYRLKVRSIGRRDSYSYFSDIYSSSDVIFMDGQLVEEYGGWPAYFSNIFDDHLFNGKEYTFLVESRLRRGNSREVVVELQSISKELYYYLKSVMYYRITDQDSYTEAIQIYSNVENGWGLFGALNSEKHVIEVE